jgi:hypothetical protein
MNPIQQYCQHVTRRHFLQECGVGLGKIAFAGLLTDALASSARATAAANPLAPRQPHFTAKAKRVIHLFMAGAPSQLDLFDYKPELAKLEGKPLPPSVIGGQRYAFIRPDAAVLGPQFKFARHGQCGAELSEVLPHLAEIVDDICLVKSVHTTQFNHAPAQIFMNTGHQIIGRPSLGAWLSYGLGSDNKDLPAFVVLISGQNNPDGGKSCWGSGFLPTMHQGVEFRSKGEPVLFSRNPDGVDAASRRDSLDLIRDLDTLEHQKVGDPETTTRIAAYELAYRMQTSVPELTDIRSEPQQIHEMYGTEPGQVSFANNCLLARRLIERGVRFVQLYHRGWDTHGASVGTDIVVRVPRLCLEVDQAIGALLTDLKQRGLLDTTLVVWGGEFGRTPINEARNGSKLLGRDHHPRAFTMWMAGGGTKPGVTVGRTDDFGYNIVEDPVDVHDLHATMLHSLGIDHEKLTYKFQGRDFRLTDVSGRVISKLLA